MVVDKATKIGDVIELNDDNLIQVKNLGEISVGSKVVVKCKESADIVDVMEAVPHMRGLAVKVLRGKWTTATETSAGRYITGAVSTLPDKGVEYSIYDAEVKAGTVYLVR